MSLREDWRGMDMTGDRKSEAQVKKEVKAYLDSIGAYHIWPVPTGYGPKLIDCFACVNGRFVGIETKREGSFATPSQKLVLTKISEAGGLSFVTWDVERLKKMIEDHVLGQYQPDRD